MTGDRGAPTGSPVSEGRHGVCPYPTIINRILPRLSFPRPCRIHITVVLLRNTYWKKQSVKSRFGRYLFWSQSCFMKSPTVGWRTGSGDSTASATRPIDAQSFCCMSILFGTILLPLMLIVTHAPFVFGYAKPVPVNFLNLRNPKRDMIWVAAAGPAMNLALAFVCTVIWKSLAPMLDARPDPAAGSAAGNYVTAIVLMAQSGILINVVLAVFNMACRYRRWMAGGFWSACAAAR